MPHTTRLSTLAAALALVAAAIIVPAGSATATSGRICTTAWGTLSNTEVKVPANGGPYVPIGGHYTDCYMKAGVGITGQGVKALQQSLRICHGQTSVAIDSSFGPATAAGLRNVQASLGISADGQYGNQSRDNLRFFMGYFGPVANCAKQPYYPNNDINYGEY